MTRGEIWWADLEQPIGRRPVVLLSRPEAYGLLTAVVAAEVTTRPRRAPTHVALGRRDGVDRPSAANLDALHTVPVGRLSLRMSVLSAKRMAEIDEALRFALSLD